MKTAAKITVIGFLCLTVSCKKKKPQEEKVNTPTEQISNKVLLPVKFESEALTVTLKYEPNSARLLEVSDSEGYLSRISYKNEQPLEIRTARNGVDFKVVDYIKTTGNETKARSFDYSNRVYIPTGYDLLGYDADSQLIKIRSFKDGGEFLQETSMQYLSANISSRTFAPKTGEPVIQTLRYDTRNGIFKHVMYPERILSSLRPTFFFTGHNNLLSIAEQTNPELMVISYLYNTDDYPSEIRLSQNKVNQTFRISYMELKI